MTEQEYAEEIERKTVEMWDSFHRGALREWVQSEVDALIAESYAAGHAEGYAAGAVDERLRTEEAAGLVRELCSIVDATPAGLIDELFHYALQILEGAS